MARMAGACSPMPAVKTNPSNPPRNWSGRRSPAPFERRTMRWPPWRQIAAGEQSAHVAGNSGYAQQARLGIKQFFHRLGRHTVLLQIKNDARIQIAASCSHHQSVQGAESPWLCLCCGRPSSHRGWRRYQDARRSPAPCSTQAPARAARRRYIHKRGHGSRSGVCLPFHTGAVSPSGWQRRGMLWWKAVSKQALAAGRDARGRWRASARCYGAHAAAPKGQAVERCEKLRGNGSGRHDRDRHARRDGRPRSGCRRRDVPPPRP